MISRRRWFTLGALTVLVLEGAAFIVARQLAPHEDPVDEPMTWAVPKAAEPSTPPAADTEARPDLAPEASADTRPAASSSATAIQPARAPAAAASQPAAVKPAPYKYPPRPAAKPDDFNLVWESNHRGLELDFAGSTLQYPRDAVAGPYPAPGNPPEVRVSKKWPVVTMMARWSIPVDLYPAKYRPHALDIVMLRVCDLENYNKAYPAVVRSTTLDAKPEFLTPAWTPLIEGFAQRMAGRMIGYTIHGISTLGDYDIKTTMAAGASADGSTIFYYDNPKSISKHLRTRQVVFAAHRKGGRIYLDLKGIYVCSDTLFKGIIIDRVADNTRYLADRLCHYMGDEAARDVEPFLQSIYKRRGDSPTPPQ
ncbi:MAG: hypothetical protein ABFD92_07240 [Planctomycetaceae bacterium]|nr:hypothetical protein [Planctomycetaceae bacterium]